TRSVMCSDDSADVPPGLVAFLGDAKKRTYAGSDDSATVAAPLLSGSMELGWADGDWLYRDIYFGMATFTGIETVYHAGEPVWAMAYSGGVLPPAAGEAAAVYSFLRAALLHSPEAFPVRGPERYVGPPHEYLMQAEGDLARFAGRERILFGGREVYALTFSGGLVR
ncbi:MAG: DUF5680 domain-containing protein, partial [Albidovulum sp.]